MHHVQFQPGQQIAAADYQAHLDRMKAIAQARQEDQVSKRSQDKTFKGYIDSEEEPADQGQDYPDEDEQGAAPRLQQDEADGEPEAPGTRYA